MTFSFLLLPVIPIAFIIADGHYYNGSELLFIISCS